MKNRPVVVGIGSIQQKGAFNELDESLILMELATKKALQDTTNTKIKSYIEEISIPKGYWRYRDPGKWIAENNQFNKVSTTISKIGILQQHLINRICKKILNGEIKAGLVLGGEARYKMLRSQIENKDFDETELKINPNNYIKSDADLNLDIEKKELGLMAVGYYAILESVLRAESSNAFDQHHLIISKMYEQFSKIAQKNNDAWTNKLFSYEDILNHSEKNPMQAFPYNKLHCTSWNVNQAGAIIICSEDIANKLDIPQTKRVYPLASSENNYMIATLQRPNLINPIGMKLAAEYILNLSADNDIKHNLYDLYSCFPVAIQMFAKSLNIQNRSNYSLTGGMAYAGGPLNSYVIHSTIKMIENIRKYPDKVGIVTGVSGMMTKQSYAMWAKEPKINFSHKDCSEEASHLEKPLEISSETEGNGKIIGYTIIKNKENSFKAIMFVETKDFKRKLITSNNQSIINLMEKNEWVGKKILFKENQLVC